MNIAPLPTVQKRLWQLVGGKSVKNEKRAIATIKRRFGKGITIERGASGVSRCCTPDGLLVAEFLPAPTECTTKPEDVSMEEFLRSREHRIFFAES